MSLKRRLGRVVLAAGLGVYAALPAAAGAAELVVGRGQQYPEPSSAAAVAKAGDTIVIEPGRYFDCAVWSEDHLTIVGAGHGAVLTDKTCEGKAIFVTSGNDIVIRNLTFTRARVPDGNGAGIRVEGRNLTVENSRFIDNEEGILAADSPGSTITIRNSQFVDNGKCAEACAHGIYVNHVALLQITGSRFYRTKMGHSVKSRSLRTVLRNNVIEDGPDGTSSYLVDIPNGGSLIMVNNVLEKGPKSGNNATAISIGEEGVSQPTQEIRITGNKFRNDNSHRTVFLRNVTATPAVLTGNTFTGDVEPLSGDGSVH